MTSLTVRAMFERPVAYLVPIAKATGCVKLTVLWSQIHYWSDKTKDPDGWVYKTMDELFEETGLTRKNQETARKLGEQLGVLDTEVRGAPPTVHFKVNLDRMIHIVEKYFEKHPEKTTAKKSQRTEKTLEWVKQIPQEAIHEFMERFSVSEKTVRKVAQDLVDYCEAKGKRYADYPAALRNFMKGHIERHPDCVERRTTADPDMEKRIEDAKTRTPEEQARISAKLDEQRKQLSEKLGRR